MSDPDLVQNEWLVLLGDVLRECRDELPYVVEAGRAAYTWRTIDAELAAVTYDSRSDDPSIAVTRSRENPPLRTLSFECPSLTIELEIGPKRVLGQLVPAGGAEMILTQRDGVRSAVPVDEIGCFTIEPLPDLSFRLEVSHEPKVVTDWITLSAGSQ